MPRYDADPLVYEIGARFVDVALRRDDSMFTPGRAIWSLTYLDELDAKYVQNPDLGTGTFEAKLGTQLNGASPEAVQLMAEALFVYYLPAHGNISGATKRQKLADVLGMSPAPVSVPHDLDAVLDAGVGSGGPGFHLYKWASMSFLITFARRWKQSPQGVRDEALSDAWNFRDFVAQIPTEGGGIYGRESLLHLAFPDTFERIFSGQDKTRVVAALGKLVSDAEEDVDRRIDRIRSRLAARFGEEFDFYSTDGVRVLWKRMADPLDEFVYWSARFYELDSYGLSEREHKLEIVRDLSEARRSVLADGDWFAHLQRAFTTRNNLLPPQVHEDFLRWCQEDLGRAAKLLRRLWDRKDEPLLRLGDSLAHLPAGAVAGLGSRAALGSFLMLAIDPYQYPPYRVAAMHAAYRLTGHEPGGEKDEVAMYRAALAFFDRLRERAAERGLALKDRLDAQSVVWSITNRVPPEAWPQEDRDAFERYRLAQGSPQEEDDTILEPEEPFVEPPGGYADPLVGLAEELLLDLTELREMYALLQAKGQIVMYGPPGTGKTYVARKLANALAGDPTRVRLVQFHPSYAYEDFIEGYRRQLIDGRPSFHLMPGPLKLLAQRATEDPGESYFLVIDELNRGNVAKVFGELYFLLEYRDHEMQLQYSSAMFRLPPNLFFIATMNTADRSIALLDAALRRRFAFVPFFPDRPPIAGLLGRWLSRHRSEMGWVAELVERANTILADRNTAIGPSFFMQADLDETVLQRIWRHEIMPLLEDYFFDAPERLKEFDLSKLRGGLGHAPDPEAASDADVTADAD